MKLDKDQMLCDLNEAISSLENFPLTEIQQSLVNYLRANVDDVAEALGLFE